MRVFPENIIQKMSIKSNQILHETQLQYILGNYTNIYFVCEIICVFWYLDLWLIRNRVQIERVRNKTFSQTNKLNINQIIHISNSYQLCILFP